MKHLLYKPYILFILIVAIFSSCEKVIDLKLNNAEKKYVIEGIVTDQAGTAKVLISQTKNFDEGNSFIGIPGATVTITENGTTTTSLSEVAPGIYVAPALAGVSGRQYSLSVTIAGKQFSAQCTMPQKVPIDTMFITSELLFGNTRKLVNIGFTDPPGLGNSYRWIQYVNGRKEDQVMIRNDEYSDARYILNKLFYFSDDDEPERTIKTGDQVTVDMECIDPRLFNYWFSLDRSATGISGQATPANPVTNLQGGALGYFSAHTLETRSMIAP
jgi:hypothetical protein